MSARTWWKVVTGNRDDLRNLAALWGGVVASPKAFDAAYAAQSYVSMVHVLGEIWHRAPDERSVYKQPGFTVLCNLLDGTVPIPEGEGDDDNGTEPIH